MNRLDQFEEMLKLVQDEYACKSEQLEQMRLAQKEKTSTFKLYMADKLMYARMLAIYEKFGLLSHEEDI